MERLLLYVSSVVPRRVLVLLDGVIVGVSFIAAYLVRFEADLPEQRLKQMVFLLPYLVCARMVSAYAVGFYQLAWRYFSVPETMIAAKMLLPSTAVLLVLRLADVSHPYLSYPISVIVLELVFSFLGVVGIRVWRRASFEVSQGRATPDVRRAIVLGAGSTGVQVVRELRRHPETKMHVVGYLDDDATKLGTVAHGVKVIGTTGEIEKAAKKTQADVAIIAMKSLTTKRMREVVDLGMKAGLTVKVIPGLWEIAGFDLPVSRIRNVEIEDLLGRDAVSLDTEAIRASLHGRVVLVTGAGGSIGSEMCRQVAKFLPSRLVLVERSENALYEIDRELRRNFPDLTIEPRLADIGDAERVAEIFGSVRPQVVIHAAAHKHVPLMEQCPGEAVKNNVFGTKTVADAAARFGVDRFVMVSTDKAVNPSSIMGATKRVAEIYIQSLSLQVKTKFITVRFGNVLGSAGSVIPLFKEQIQRGGPVTVTHAEMKRYFMTIPEASQLVLQAATQGNGGEIFVLDMGEPVKIVDLARDLIRLSGLRPGEDIEIQFSGVRPGEKLYEELSLADELVAPTVHPKVFAGRIRPYQWNEVEAALGALARCTEKPTREQVRTTLKSVVGECTFDGPAHVAVAAEPVSSAAAPHRSEAPVVGLGPKASLVT